MQTTSSGNEATELPVISIDTRTPGEVRLRFLKPLDTEEVTEGTVVLQIAGKPVDFQINGTQVESLGISLVIDTSGSMQGEALASAQEAAIQFISSLPQDSLVSIIAAGEKSTLLQPATSNQDSLLAAINNLQAQGETSLYDGVAIGLQSLPQTNRQAVVLLSDGGDTVSESTLEESIEAVESSSARLFSVGLATDEANSEVLQQLAQASGGQSVSADSTQDLEQIFSDIAIGLGVEYEIIAPFPEEGQTSVTIQVGSTNWSRTVLPSALSKGDSATFTAQPDPQVFLSTESFASSASLLWVGTVLLCGAVVCTGWYLVSSRKDHSQKKSNRSPQLATLRELRQNATNVFEGNLVRNETKADLALKIEQAGLEIRAGEFLLIIVLLTMFLAAIASLAFGFFFGLFAGFLGIALPNLFLRLLRKRRLKKFADQLPAVLNLLSNSLKAGYSLPQAVNAVTKDVHEPIHSELNRALIEARIGGDLTQSLGAVASRTGNNDMQWAVDAIEINAQVGGDLVEVLENVSQTIRARIRLKAQVSALTAEGRLSAFVLLGLPPSLTLLIALINPEYFEGIWGTSIGYGLFGCQLLLLILGGLWLKKMISSVSL